MDESLGVGGVGGGEDVRSSGLDLDRSPVMQVGGRVHADPAMAVLGVVPGGERGAEGAGVLDGAEGGGELGAVFQGFEVRF